MPIGDLIDMDRECATPDCKHKRGAHGGTYYKRDCGVINCTCREFAEVRFSRNNTTWDGLVSEANRMDNELRVWKIRQKQTEDANKELRSEVARLKSEDNQVRSITVENDALRSELVKCQEVLELLKAAGKLPRHLGDWLLGDPVEADIEDF